MLEMLERKIYDIGYGISTKEEFVNRLKSAFPDGDAMIVDIRKAGSGSRNGGWANWGEEMSNTCSLSGNQYSSIPQLSNPYGNGKKGLWDFTTELSDGWRRKHIDRFANMVRSRPQIKYCLLCSERKPYKGTYKPTYEDITTEANWTGDANCHRVAVANFAVSRLFLDHEEWWESIHLYSANPKGE